MYAYEHGVNYYDSAYVYHDGKSEVAIGEVFKNNDIRDKINIATKLPTFGHFAEGNFNDAIEEQLRRLQSDYINFYLIHGLNGDRWDDLKKHGIVEFLDDLKKSDKVEFVGFSFHDTNENFVKIIDDYDWNFAQVQLNFVDVEYQAGIAGLEYAYSKGIPLTIMEPLRGGRLIGVRGPEVDEIKEKYAYTEDSIAPAAFGFLFNRPEILTVLSGMHRLSDVEENVETASSIGPGELSAANSEFLAAIKEYLESKDTIPCTGCGYCLSECPQEIRIPQVLGAYNDAIVYNSAEFNAGQLRRNNTNVENCVECCNCAEVCPQHIAIPEMLKKTRELLGV
jgi:predicted aldo/keto reductase-like oxidoreductase